MIDVCCSTCQSIGINMQETSSEMRDYNGRLLFFVLKCCCMSEQVLIRWAELHCLPSLRLAFSYSSTFPPFVPIPNSLLGVVKLLCAHSRGLGCFFPLSLGCSWDAPPVSPIQPLRHLLQCWPRASAWLKLSLTPNGPQSVSGVVDLPVSCTPTPDWAQGLTASGFSVYWKILLRFPVLPWGQQRDPGGCWLCNRAPCAASALEWHRISTVTTWGR